MTFFIPRIYEDEILYSFISRYHERSGNIYAPNSLEELFSMKKIRPNLYLPSYIDNLFKNFPINCKYTIEEIIFKHTLYPFYTCFESKEFSDDIFNLMRSNDNNKVKNKCSSVNIKINNIYLKFCKECMKEDFEKYGETYWHRIHQTPYVLVCPKHNKVLYDSSVKINDYKDIKLIAASESNCICNYDKEYQPAIKEKLYNLSKNIELIMNTNFDKKTPDWYKNNYINILIKKGLATSKGTLKGKELIESFKAYYTEGFLDLLGCNINKEKYKNSWLIEILRKPRHRHHPVKHLLVIDFLGYSIEDIINNEIIYKPFGEGPWPCLNKLCHNYRSNVIHNVTISKITNGLKGTFTCDDCGLTYTRNGPDEDKINQYKISTYKDMGHLWKSKLQELLITPNITISEMEKVLGVSKETIYLHAKKSGICTYSIENYKRKRKGKSSKIDCKKNNKDYYERWENLINNNPNKSKTELINLDKATYSWLYRHDKEWLDEITPKPKNTSRRKVDWNKRDDEILKLIKESIKVDLNSDDKPVRLTIREIGRQINKPLGDYLRMDKMPKSKQYVTKIVDDEDRYIKKRIVWAINYSYNHEDEPISISYIMKKSGIQYKFKSKYEDYISKILKYKFKAL